MGINILIFALLAVCTNTAIPIPFEAVFFYHLAKYPDSGLLLVIAGSLCAAIAGWIDLSLASQVRKRMLKHFPQQRIEAGIRFYTAAFLFALLPFPFSVIRASLLKIRANPAIYSGVIFPGRLVRYSLLITATSVSGLSAGIIIATFLIVVAWIAKRQFLANRRILSGVLP